jgi:LysM repeat protein
MKWKEADSGNEETVDKSDPYYEDDGYASFSDKGLKNYSFFGDQTVPIKKWGVIAAVVFAGVLLLLFFFTLSSSGDSKRIAELEKKVEQLERQLEKFEGVDEKVTRIWEQAKAFETFKTRFDRSEASISLRMDHFAMSLDALQKKTDRAVADVSKVKKAQARQSISKKKATVKPSATGKTHTVAAGDTLYSISKKYKLSVDELKALNRLKTGAVIHVGQTLKVSK